MKFFNYFFVCICGFFLIEIAGSGVPDNPHDRFQCSRQQPACRVPALLCSLRTAEGGQEG